MSFDADKFLNQTVSGPISTYTKPCPEGEFRAMIDDSDKWLTFSGGTSDKGNEWNKASILVSILDDAVKASLGRDKVLVPYDCFLDLDASGGMDTSEGKNTSIGKLRAACSQMEDTSWSLGKLKGYGPIMVKVAQRSDKRPGADPTEKFAGVVRVAKIS